MVACCVSGALLALESSPVYRKGSRLRFLHQNMDNNVCGNATEPRDTSECPEESSLFFLTVLESFNDPEIGLSGDRVRRLVKQRTSRAVRCALVGP